MTIEKIYKAYTENAQIRADHDLETAMGQVLNRMNEAGIDTMAAEEQINAMLDRQEAVAFQAGFREALELVFSTTN